MLYVLFFILATSYNWRKFLKEREAFLESLATAKSLSQREMILGHHFYIYIFESFLAVVVAHFISEKSPSIGIIGLGLTYIAILFFGYFLYQFFIHYLERITQLELQVSFGKNLIKEIRVSFAIIILPVIIYSVMNVTFRDGVFEEWGSFWFIGLFFNILFISVLTIICSVIIMLRLIPNREVNEPDYVAIIQKRLEQIQVKNMRVRWIETDIKNAFVVGLKILNFSNQTMFVGKKLRTLLTVEEFDAIISHELAHVANRHIHKRLINIVKNMLTFLMGLGSFALSILLFSFLYFGDDLPLHLNTIVTVSAYCSLIWFFINYAFLFDSMRSHEYEADAFAVINLGVDFEVYKSALLKLTNQDEIPDYLKAKMGSQHKTSELKGIKRWLRNIFSTHPDVDQRLDSIKMKIEQKLPFDYYDSSWSKLSILLGQLVNWKILIPGSATLAAALFFLIQTLMTGKRDIAFILNATPLEIRSEKSLISKINSRPMLVGPTLMSFVVSRKNEDLINYFLANGADKGKLLIYLSEQRDIRLFQNYYTNFETELSQSEFFLILRRSTQLEFQEAIALLESSKRFSKLEKSYRNDLMSVKGRSSDSRRPASVK